MTNKELYTEWASQQENLPIFMQPWWLDAVCAGKLWDVLLSHDAEGEIRGALPYLLRKKWWLRWIVMPQETQIGGLWLSGGADTEAVCRDIAAQLADMKLAYYYQHYPIDSPAPAFMAALGFQRKERITYRIEDTADTEQIASLFSKNKKRQIQKAATLHAQRGMDAETFYRLHREFLETQRKAISYTREFLLVLDRKARRNDRAEIISIHSETGEVYAAAYLVWDKQSMYYLIPCYNPLYKDSGAGALLVLEALKLAREKGVSFDFEGSMVRGIANHYRQFGSKKTTYYSVEKYYKPLFAIILFINKIRNLKYGV